MARIPMTTAPSRAYAGMLLITCVAMAVGIAVMVLEGGEYDWTQQPAKSPALAVPDYKSLDSLKAQASAEASAAAPVPAEPAPLKPAAVVTVAKPEPAKTEVAEAPKPVEFKPAPVPPQVITGPIPSPLIIPGR